MLETPPINDWPEVVGNISLLRFLRGCGGEVVAAEALFRDHVKMRKEFGFNECRKRCFAETIRQHGSFSQEDMLHGALVASYIPISYNAGFTPRGDPICAFWYV